MASCYNFIFLSILRDLPKRSNFSGTASMSYAKFEAATSSSLPNSCTIFAAMLHHGFKFRIIFVNIYVHITKILYPFITTVLEVETENSQVDVNRNLTPPLGQLPQPIMSGVQGLLRMILIQFHNQF
jgi:hypothetical protein